MHLLAAQPGTIHDGEEAIDLSQSEGDVIVLSAADTEIALLAAAYAATARDYQLRLANLMQMKHPMSVDLYLEKTCGKAKIIVARLLGGRGYWAYLVDELTAYAARTGVLLALLPGDAAPDAALAAASNVGHEDYARLASYLIEGGPSNAAEFLNFLAEMAGFSAPPAAPPRPLLKAGLYAPGQAEVSLGDIRKGWLAGAPVAMIGFYRALLEGGNTAPIDALIEGLKARGINPLAVFVPSLKDDLARALLADLAAKTAPAIILNTTGFAVSAYDGSAADNPFPGTDCPVLQVVLASSTRAAWQTDSQGLSARDLAMHVVLPELDGRLMARVIAFKSAGRFDALTETSLVAYEPAPDRVAYVCDLAARWIRLRTTAAHDRRIAIILANYPNRDGRIGNGVGYDTPQSTVEILKALREAGYRLEHIPETGTAFIHALLEGTTNAKTRRSSSPSLDIDAYHAGFACLPEAVRTAVTTRWGRPEDDPHFSHGAFRLPVMQTGSIAIGIQPARGYNIDPKATYHDPALVPPHGYFAFYIWLREHFLVDAVIHNGKHGNLEWLPGKALALSADCYPEAVMGPVPNLYPFIVNDPGEGTQAKRRISAVIIDHLTPPLTRAESYGPMKDLEALVDEYYQASGLDPRRLKLLSQAILDLVRRERLDLDAGILPEDNEGSALQKLDAYLCDLKEAQIRDGLHVFGQSPAGDLERDLLVALTRLPRGPGEGGDQSLIRALAQDLALGFDPLDCDPASPWPGPRPSVLAAMSRDMWRITGDTVERLELLARKIVDSGDSLGFTQTAAVLDTIRETIRPALTACGVNEMRNLLIGLDGRLVPPGPSGAPTRGRLDVLPTGRNFFSIDNRTLPTPAAWALGRKSAELLVKRFFQDEGSYPRALGLSAWGTSNMRTGGDDIAQALALIGVQPLWEPASGRVTGFKVMPLAAIGRPRVDVTLRISGFFRDAFPAQIALFDSAVQAVAALEEDADDNPIAASAHAEGARATAAGHDGETAVMRIFGSKPGAYGAGLQALIDEKIWSDRNDFARAYVEWSGYAYGAKRAGDAEHDAFRARLGKIEAVIHNQDNREHDLLDSDDYYQFEGGMTAAVEAAAGQRPKVYHNDHSRPERPVIRTLEEEISRVMRARVVNPKWIAGVMRHGYKGAFEIAATVDYMFAFAATTGAVRDHHFDMAYDAFIADARVRDFIAENNAPALTEIAGRLREAIDRGLWTPKLNSAYGFLTDLKEA
ncbi:MAG: cobaltochelatase subunit CobN [Rhizobiales bacterium]|nr:cobaltochelatase subunit CobN [Hyphomicrobiales bacterium]